MRARRDGPDADSGRVRERLLGALDAWREEMRDFTAEMVAIPTQNPPGESYRECAELIAGHLRRIGLPPEVIEAPAPDAGGGPRFVLRAFHGRGRRTLYFHGHYDVVPASSPAQFRPVVRKGCLHGRGSTDMKGGLAAMIYAARAMRECALPLKGRIGLVIVPDEETGGAMGSQYLARRGLIGRDGIGMLMPEPSGGMVWHASRGALSLRVTVKGRSAHVALQHRGVNAFERMLAVAGALAELKSEVEARRTEYRIEPDAARRSILMMGGRCEGGTNFNLVPGSCSFTIDRRINPEEDLATEKARLFGLFDGLRRQGVDLDVEVLQEAESSGSPARGPVAEALADSVAAVTGAVPAFEMCPGLLETRFYARRGVPAYAYGPGLLTVAHGPKEFVRLSDVQDCAAIYALTAARVLAR